MYTIQVEGHLDPRYSSWFENMTVSTSFSGEVPTTLLSGALSDQAALHGLLDKLRAMGIVLLNVNRLEPPA